MDCCNSLLFDSSDGLPRRLQAVQNAAARLDTGTRRSYYTSGPSWGNFSGCQCNIVMVYTRRWTACLRSAWRMTASLPLPPAADDFDRPTSLRARFQELAWVWATARSRLLDRVSGSVYLSTFVILNILGVPPGYWRRTCFADDRSAIATVDIISPYKSHLQYIHITRMYFHLGDTDHKPTV